jgi:hypothetical protein
MSYVNVNNAAATCGKALSRQKFRKIKNITANAVTAAGTLIMLILLFLLTAVIMGG